MKVTYLAHSGFLVELDETYLLFDYYRGILPKFQENKPLYVFVSHGHQDHFNPEIFSLTEQHARTMYILSYDIKVKPYQVDKWNLTKSVLEKIQSVRADQTYRFTKDGKLCDEGECEVTTLKSTDAGVAFLIRTEGKTIYHGGDFNWWYREGESKQYNHNMTANFCREADKMTGVSVDIAFLPLDPRQGKDYRRGFDYMLKTANIKTAFPMHMWEDYAVIQKYKEEGYTGRYDTNVMDIDREGQEWDIFTFPC